GADPDRPHGVRGSQLPGGRGRTGGGVRRAPGAGGAAGRRHRRVCRSGAGARGSGLGTRDYAGCAVPLAQGERHAAEYPGTAGRILPATRLCGRRAGGGPARSEEHTSELQSHLNLVCRLLLEKKKTDIRVTQKVNLPLENSTTETLR